MNRVWRIEREIRETGIDGLRPPSWLDLRNRGRGVAVTNESINDISTIKPRLRKGRRIDLDDDAADSRPWSPRSRPISSCSDSRVRSTNDLDTANFDVIAPSVVASGGSNLEGI